ncbi:DUF6612 family protein [Cohnella cellulosilytica]|uniref:DUF6612 family protein n=1 Tax=Cohnella cellulosilytica TaxID=986710 RepID=A0ABW2FD96_9BACL
MRNSSQPGMRRKAAVLCAACAVGALLLVSCAGKKEAEQTPPPTAARKITPAEQWLERAASAAATMKKYAFELQMTQELGPAGDSKRSDVRVDMQGKAEREPLKLDQTITSVIDGEASTLRSIVTPEGYFMYLPEYEEWSRLSKEVAEENAETLSDFQINPERAIERFRQLGEGLSAERSGNSTAVRYEGAGPEAKTFMAGLMKSTLGLTDSEEVIAEELAVSRLKVAYYVDNEQHWPLSYRIETELTVELEPGQKTPVTMTLAGTYSKPNATAAIVVPPEALEAPDPAELEDLLDFGT